MKQLVLLSLFLLLSVSFLCEAHDHMGMHSLYPPILENYWDNGLGYWSFGSASVVTDGMVRLTSKRPKAHGYLWNKHANHLPSWRMNVTLQLDAMSQLGGGDDSTADTAGVGVWFTTDTPRHGDVSFFGAPSRFVGLGITMDHNSVISVFVSDGYSSISDPVRQRRGFCRANSKSVTITVTYIAEAKALTVGYNPVDRFTDGSTLSDAIANEELLDTYSKKKAQNAEARRKFLNTIGDHCATLGDVELTTHSYFGVTASNSATKVAMSEIQSFFVRPLDRDDDDVEEQVGLKMFDMVLDVSQRKAATGREDEPLSEALAQDPFNFPREKPLKKEKAHRTFVKKDQDGVLPHKRSEKKSVNVQPNGDDAVQNEGRQQRAYRQPNSGDKADVVEQVVDDGNQEGRQDDPIQEDQNREVNDNQILDQMAPEPAE